MQKIVTHLWFDNQANDQTRHCEIAPRSPTNDVKVILDQLKGE